jgi:hypothetical protein
LEKRLAAQHNATPDGYEAPKTELVNLGASMSALQGQVGNLRHARKGDFSYFALDLRFVGHRIARIGVTWR